VSWWLAALFTAGSTLFVIGGILAFTNDPSARWFNLVGSVGFSVGALLAIVEASDAAHRLNGRRTPGSVWATAAGQASFIQGISAVILFQFAMVAAAADTSLSWIGDDIWIWTPSTLGSVGFVIAGRILWLEAKPAADIGSTAARFNLVGGACFLGGSLAGYFAHGPFEVGANLVSNPVFLIGSLAFLIGSGLSLVELDQPLRANATATPPTVVTQ